MKLAEKTQNVRTSGSLGKTQAFGAEMNAKAFHILSDKLYTDKILAIVRELSTNAYESHVMADNLSTPFEVNLPSTMNNQFYIRDYGTGLTPDEIYDIYTVYFKSTKTDSNDVGGCFGLGSKSPLSYTDNFLVESFKDGTKYIYSCHYNDERIPCVTEMGSMPTDEPNGVKVGFSVNSSDNYYFKEVAQKVYPYFEVCPKINCHIDPVEYSTKHDRWGVKNDTYDSSKIVMGNINYPFPSRNFLSGIANDEINNDDLDRIYNILTNHSIDLFFEIGELEVGVSRESIEETNKNAMAIYNIAKSICEELGKDVKKKLDSFDNFKDCDEYYSYLDNLSHSLVYPYLFDGARRMVRDNREQLRCVDVTGNRYSTYNTSRITKNHISNLNQNNDLTIFEADCGNCDKRIRSWIRNDYVDDGTYVIDVEFDSLFNRLDNMYAFNLEFSDIKKASDLPKPTVSSGSRSKFVPVCVFSHNTATLVDSWNKSTDGPDDIKVYVEIKANKYKCNIARVDGMWRHPRAMQDYFAYLKKIGVDIPKIHGIKTSALDKTLKSCKKQPKELSVWLKDKVQELYKKYPIEKYADLDEVYKQVSHYSRNTYVDILSKVIKLLDHNNDLINRINGYINQDCSEREKHRNLEMLTSCIGQKVPKLPKSTLDVKKDIKEIDKKYPLLKFLGKDRDWNRVDPASVAQYINAMEK